MQLTRAERWILSNQYRILEALYPKEAEYLAYGRKALECGYELEYDGLAEAVYEDSHCLSSEGCEEVLDILQMFSSLKDSYEALEDKSGIDVNAMTFRGFSGNDEGKQMAYAHYFCGKDGGRFTDLERGDNFDSHFPYLDVYRRMLREWHNSDNKYQLSKEDIARIAAARPYPE